MTRIPSGLWLVLLMIFLLLMGLTGCGGGQKEMAWPPRTVKEPPAGVGTPLSGVIQINGSVPEPRLISIVDAFCVGRGAKIYDESLLAQDGKLRNVLVWIKSGLEGWTFDWDRNVVEMDQKDCVFLPHVKVVRVQQPVKFINSDGTSHNVNTQNSRQKGNSFNFSLIPNGGHLVKQFTAPEIGVRVRCDVHPNMLAYLHVVDHPFAAVSDADGRWTFSRPLPPGEYILEAWHGKLGSLEQKIKVDTDGAVTAAPFVFEAK